MSLNDGELRYVTELFGLDPALIEEIADMLWAIEGNYNQEGSGTGSRFAGQRLEIVQACAVVRRLREYVRVHDSP